MQVVPLSSNIDRIYPSETVVVVAGQKGKAMADQLTTADKRRLNKVIGNRSQADIRAVDIIMKIQLGIES